MIWAHVFIFMLLTNVLLGIDLSVQIFERFHDSNLNHFLSLFITVTLTNNLLSRLMKRFIRFIWLLYVLLSIFLSSAHTPNLFFAERRWLLSLRVCTDVFNPCCVGRQLAHLCGKHYRGSPELIEIDFPLKSTQPLMCLVRVHNQVWKTSGHSTMRSKPLSLWLRKGGTCRIKLALFIECKQNFIMTLVVTVSRFWKKIKKRPKIDRPQVAQKNTHICIGSSQII